jgi:hypothetical protein
MTRVQEMNLGVGNFAPERLRASDRRSGSPLPHTTKILECPEMVEAFRAEWESIQRGSP